jgi:mono/diheme cytochrome c family protein
MSKGVLGAVLVFAMVAGVAIAQTDAGSKSANGSSLKANLARGKYLVNNVGMCGDCHTPTDRKGQPIKSKDLRGSVLMFKPTVPVPGWMEAAPGIVGLNWTDEQAIRFFNTGKRPNGTMAAPPMPQFRFNKADAAAITAYLKSLKP